MRCLAIDIGLAHNGAALVELRGPPDQLVCLGAWHIQTKPAPAKSRRGQQARDDARRVSDVGAWWVELLDVHRPDLVAMEWYAPYDGRPVRGGWKTLFVAGLVVQETVTNRHIDFYPQTVRSLKKFVGGDGTKAATQSWVEANVIGAAEHLSEFRAAVVEHPADAVAHAALALSKWTTEKEHE